MSETFAPTHGRPTTHARATRSARDMSVGRSRSATRSTTAPRNSRLTSTTPGANEESGAGPARTIDQNNPSGWTCCHVPASGTERFTKTCPARSCHRRSSDPAGHREADPCRWLRRFTALIPAPWDQPPRGVRPRTTAASRGECPRASSCPQGAQTAVNSEDLAGHPALRRGEQVLDQARHVVGLTDPAEGMHRLADLE